MGGTVDSRYSNVDVGCGDAIVLYEIKRQIPNLDAYGIDCNKGNFSTHIDVQQEGVKLVKGYLQHFFNPERGLDEQFDFGVMLNTYRGWKYAHLEGRDKELPIWEDIFWPFVTFSG